MIDSGQIKCGMVVAGENGRPLVEQTLQHLLTAPLNRNEIKPFFANLTIGSGAVAAMVCHEDLLPAGSKHRLLAGAYLSATQHSELCQGDTSGQGAADGDRLGAVAGRRRGGGARDMAEIRAGDRLERATPDHIICHQVGSTHRRKLYETVGLDLAKDFSTFETLGNTGSAALPTALALAVDRGVVKPGHKVALLGIGSGINSLMLAVEW
jgi:3-oxoacyl-[acyl-carrier-protein] synthase III